MRLYHGTNVDFDLIDIEKSNPYKDFGKGFYLTDIKEQAERMALRKVNFLVGFLLFRFMTLTKPLYRWIN